MSEERRLAAPRETVWAALNDLDTLRASIPGCDKLEGVSDTVMVAEVKTKVGPVAATFKGRLTSSDIDAPNGYTLEGEGQGGAAGRAKERLLAVDDDTVLKYEVDVTVGGKLAQLGSRLIDATARKLADEFFDRFAARFEPRSEPGDRAELPEAPSRGGLRPLIWVPLLIALVTLILYVFSSL
ncbi:MAG: CoxG family protein [Bacteroidota bacterium]